MIKANSVKHHFESLVAFPGMYCRLRLHLGQNPDGLRQYFASLKPGTPIVVSSLLKWERQVTGCHARLRLHNENTVPIESKRVYEVHAGFRRFRANMIFSKIYSHCDKTKFCQTLDSYEDLYLGSYYGQIYFPPKKVAVFSIDASGNPICLSMTGQVEYPDPFKVILKRIILTGYPAKVGCTSSHSDRKEKSCHLSYVLQSE